MEYTHDDAGLITQPIGYWAPTAGSAVVAYIRAGLAEFDVSQPQWWIMNQAASGSTRTAAVTLLKGYNDEGAPSIEAETDVLVSRGLVTMGDNDLLQLTGEGDRVFQLCVERQASVREQIHRDISDEEFLTTIKVLQRVIHNVGAEAWHH